MKETRTGDSGPRVGVGSETGVGTTIGVTVTASIRYLP